MRELGRAGPGPLPGDAFDRLAAGLGGGDTVRLLADAQLGRHLLLLKYVAAQWPGRPAERDAALAALGDAQARDARVYRRRLGDPLVGAWLTRMTRRLRGVDAPGPAGPDLGYLSAVAAAAALEAGVRAEVTAHARDGWLVLPGVAAVRAGHRTGPVAVAVADGRLSVDGARVGPGRAWQALRTLRGGGADRPCEVTLEEADPYRDCYHAPAAVRMPAGDAARWRRLFADAWRLTCRFLPARADELAAGLRSLVPLTDDGTGAARSCTARDAFGMVGLTRPRSPADLVVTLVHEFQHSKLSALLNLAELHRPDGVERHFAPWRTDPRPTGGLLQGVYAFVAIADVWNGLRAVGPLREQAERELAATRELVAVGLAGLEGSAELTPLGRRFVAGMRAAHERLVAEPLPPGHVRRGRAVLAERRAAWLARHGDRGRERSGLANS